MTNKIKKAETMIVIAGKWLEACDPRQLFNELPVGEELKEVLLNRWKSSVFDVCDVLVENPEVIEAVTTGYLDHRWDLQEWFRSWLTARVFTRQRQLIRNKS